MNFKWLFFVLALSFTSLTSCNNTNDFDLVCNYFDSLRKEAANNSMSPDDKYQFINDLLVKNPSPDSPAKISFNAVVGYVPSDGRYTLYIDAAESTLNKNWKCKSMNTLLQDF